MRLLHFAGLMTIAREVAGYNTNGYMPGRRPFKVKRDFSCFSDNRRFDKEELRKAFQNLAEELESARVSDIPPRRPKDDATSVSSESWANEDFGRFPQNDEDRAEFARKQKGWINKAFDLASDLNENFASSAEERKENDEILKNIQGWVNKVIIDDDDKVDASAPVSSDMSPSYEVKNTDETFEVSLDVPGVEKTDIDIQVNDDEMVLTVSGARKSSSDQPASIKFSKEFLLEDTVQTAKISAKLENGVLVIRAPKKPNEEVQKGRSIPIA